MFYRSIHNLFFSRPIDNIFLINTFDENGTTSFFIGQAVEEGRELALQGPGELNCTTVYAH